MAELVPEQSPGSVARRDMRVSDEERTAVLDELRAHFGAGRIDLSEFEERTNAVVVARFRGELTPLLADLPELHPAPATSGSGAPRRSPRKVMDSVGFQLHLYVSLVISAFLLAIYGGVNLIGDSTPFWPVFPISALGLAVGVHAAVRKALSG